MAKTFRRKSRNVRKLRKRPIHKKRSIKRVMKKRKSTRRYNRRMKGGEGQTVLGYFKGRSHNANTLPDDMPIATNPSLGPHGFPTGPITQEQLTAATISDDLLDRETDIRNRYLPRDPLNYTTSGFSENEGAPLTRQAMLGNQRVIPR